MAGVITLLNTFPANNGVRGIAFKGNDLWLAGFSGNFLAQMDKTTGAETDHAAGFPCWQTNYDAGNDQFWCSSAGVANTRANQFAGTGALIANRVVGTSPYAQGIGSVHYWCANQASEDFTVLARGSGAFVATVPYLPLFNGMTNMVYDGAGSLWLPTGNKLIQLNDAASAIANVFTVAGATSLRGVAFALGGLWIVDGFNSTLIQMDLAGNVLNTFALFSVGTPANIAFDGTNFWTMDFGGFLSVTSPAGVFQATIAAGGNLQWIAADGTPNECWLTLGSSPLDAAAKQFLFTPAPQGGAIVGTFTAVSAPGLPIIGGTK